MQNQFVTRDVIPNIRSYFKELQQNICEALAAEDNHGAFVDDEWTRAEGGGGSTRVLKKGAVFEQAGVNFSHVFGESLPLAATAHRRDLQNSTFQALGVSIVIHPINPYVPTTHANVRFIMTENENHTTSWWFGGGFNLTPYYPFDEDCHHWHQTAAKACAPFGSEVYPKYKKWCDEYFYLKHRDEQRGIGGLFFDDLNDLNNWPFDTCFAFIKSIGNHFMEAYRPIVARRKALAFGSKEREFQRYRRGRYVEFNLLYDRGTLFGLQSNGRVESILMSLPPDLRFEYNWQGAPGSPEADLISKYLKRREWL